MVAFAYHLSFFFGFLAASSVGVATFGPRSHTVSFLHWIWYPWRNSGGICACKDGVARCGAAGGRMIYTAHLWSSFGCELYSKSALLPLSSFPQCLSVSHFLNFAIYPRTGSTILPPFSFTFHLHIDRKTSSDPRGSQRIVFFYL